MIGRLTGNIIEARPDAILLDVAGVGYLLSVPMSTYLRLVPTGAGPVSLHVHTHVREDAIQLFGFATTAERGAFESLVSVSGIGPKLALAVLSATEVDDLERAIAESDRAALERVPGSGRRTAERLIVELRDRLPKPETGASRRGIRSLAVSRGPESTVDADAVSALLHLGYPENLASEAITRVRRGASSELPLEDVLRAALRTLAR